MHTGEEFFLFMDMHAEAGWVSFGMTSHKWALAALDYNE
jgi:hypothetical protein